MDGRSSPFRLPHRQQTSSALSSPFGGGDTGGDTGGNGDGQQRHRARADSPRTKENLCNYAFGGSTQLKVPTVDWPSLPKTHNCTLTEVGRFSISIRFHFSLDRGKLESANTAFRGPLIPIEVISAGLMRELRQRDAPPFTADADTGKSVNNLYWYLILYLSCMVPLINRVLNRTVTEPLWESRAVKAEPVDHSSRVVRTLDRHQIIDNIFFFKINNSNCSPCLATINSNRILKAK